MNKYLFCFIFIVSIFFNLPLLANVDNELSLERFKYELRYINDYDDGFAPYEKESSWIGETILSKFKNYDVSKKIFLKSTHGRIEKISVISHTHAQKLFKELKELDIPFKFGQDGCYARAHFMSQFLAKKGLAPYKLFVEGFLQVESIFDPGRIFNWWYHVAPVIIVTKDGVNSLFVFDPSIATRPLSYSEWIKLQTRHDHARVDNIYITNQYSYVPSNKVNESLSYSDSDSGNMERILNEYSERLKN